MGTQTGQGYYRYPNPAFQDPEFLAVSDIKSVPEIVARAKPSGHEWSLAEAVAAWVLAARPGLLQ